MNIDLEKIKKLPPDVRDDFMRTFLQYEEKKKESKIRSDFLTFVKHMWPDFIEGSHHKIVADKFNKLAEGKIKRLIINMPPRHTKSEFASYFLPAWMVGKNPKLKIIQSTNTTELSVRFGRKAKALMDSAEYKQVFQTRLNPDSQAAGKWETAQGGEYYAAGVGSAITGRGADLLIIDDPHTEQDAMNSQALERTFEWYTSGPRQRLQPGGSIVVVMTRWNSKDLAGRLVHAQKEPRADQWEVVEFPAIMPSGEPLWPEYWKLDDLQSVKASIPISKWNAQYMQNPTSEEGALIKREWWQTWEDDIPPLQHVIQSYDTAFMKKETADYSAITTWGVFQKDEDSGPQLMLVDAIIMKAEKENGDKAFSVADKDKLLNKADVDIVKTVRLDSLPELQNITIDLLQIDTQGAELMVLKGTTGILSNVQSLMLEVHTKDFIKPWDREPYRGQCYLNELVTFLKDHDLSVKYVGLDNEGGNGQGNSFWCKENKRSEK